MLPIAQTCFERRSFGDGVTLITKPHVDRFLRCNTWHVRTTRFLAEGDVVDLGDRSFEVLHLPGHSPGSIGLWEARTGILFSVDALYDGPLLDELPGSDIDDYVATMRRLREWPVSVVGHELSFGRARLVELVDAYLARRSA